MTTLGMIDNPQDSWHCSDCGSPFQTRLHVGGMRGGLPRRQTKIPTVCSNSKCVRSNPSRVGFGSAVLDQR